MSVLDLQAIKPTQEQGNKPSGSRASKNCNNGGGGGNTSTLSVAICAF